MKFVDTFFKIPIRIYENADIYGAASPGSPIKASIGVKRLRHLDIVGWQDMSFREIDTTEEFPCTLINTAQHDFLCHWPRKKFEAELEAYSEKYEKWLEGELGKMGPFLGESEDLDLT